MIKLIPMTSGKFTTHYRLASIDKDSLLDIKALKKLLPKGTTLGKNIQECYEGSETSGFQLLYYYIACV